MVRVGRNRGGFIDSLPFPSLSFSSFISLSLRIPSISFLTLPTFPFAPSFPHLPSHLFSLHELSLVSLSLSCRRVSFLSFPLFLFALHRSLLLVHCFTPLLLLTYVHFLALLNTFA